MKKAVEELTTASHKLAEEIYKSGAEGAEGAQQAGAETETGTGEEEKDKEDVVEAELKKQIKIRSKRP